MFFKIPILASYLPSSSCSLHPSYDIISFFWLLSLLNFVLQTKIIGVEPYDANAMALSLHHGHRVMLEQVGGFADGVAVKEVGEETFRICNNLVDGIVLVNRDAICASIKVSF